MPLTGLEEYVLSKLGLYRRKFKLVLLWLADMVFFAITLPLALFVRLDFNPPQDFLTPLLNKYLLVGAICFTITSFFMKTYSTIIRLANLNTAIRIAIASGLGTTIFYLSTTFVFRFELIPRSTFLIQMLLFIPLAIFCRFSFRLLERFMKFFEEGIPTLIYGAGRTTNIFLPALLKLDSKIKVVGLIDDDSNKRRGEVQGVPVLGSGEDLAHLVQKHSIEQVIICMPTLEGAVLRKLVAKLRNLSVVVKIAPEANSYINAVHTGEKITLRDIKIEDLLRRNARKVDQEAIAGLIKNETIIVTGGGGSIGSELCRQILAMSPFKLIVNDASEYNLYSILEELRETYPDRDITPLLGDLSHKGVCEEIFKTHRIDLVFHAAAYKHVPLVEENITNSIRNNVLSTYNLFESAWAHNVKKVILVSSDKAVNPTNAMGATKRVCEMIGIYFSQRSSSTSFSAVRFGNVLGSSGSVIPKFLRQIHEGGPLTITHPDINRYFMLINEAVSLVLQASGASKAGEIYILDMHEPIKILDLAKDLLGIMGLREGIDIHIEFTGLRPGEKMFEELYLGGEELERISSDFYRVVHQHPLTSVFQDHLEGLIRDLYTTSPVINRKKLFKLLDLSVAQLNATSENVLPKSESNSPVVNGYIN